MSSYRKTMSEAYKSIYLTKNDTLKPIKEEVELDEGTSQVLAHGGKGQYKVTSGGGVTTVKFKGKVVSSGDFDQGADGWFMNIKGEKGQKFFDTAQKMADYFAKNKITEEVDLDEMKSTMYALVIDGKVVAKGSKSDMMRKKKKEGGTVYNTPGSKIGDMIEEADLDEGTWYTAKNMTRLQKMIQKPMPKNHTSVKFVMKHIGDDELMDNMDDAKNGTDLSPMVKSAMKRIGIKEEAVSMAQQAAIAISKKERGNKPKKEEVELDELKPPSRHVGKSQKNPDMFAVYDQEEKEVELFKDKKDAEEYAVKNHDALMGHDKPKNVKEEVGIDEGFSPKEIKMAIGVASDKRYAGGNMTGAVDAIDKIKKGLSDHPQVAAVLRRQNEEVELDEHKGTEPHKHPHPKDVDEASARADAMRAMRKGKTVDPADVDTDASDDDVKSASKNIIMQLRKSVSLRGNFPVEFTDKKKVKVSAKIAQAVQNKHNSMKKANDKEKFQAKVSKSYKDMLSALKENTILDKVSKKLKEIKNG